ncbi:H-NS family nucleoid-associated regulatory protein, partial [Achromobacter xylosoxidans]|uniref:H-NS family nucleoid-associated regulatory protein n=1 Tax=Alcaligenes xylosoxydans xylosoxydans TaxID=85698 RepID=UPI000667A4F7
MARETYAALQAKIEKEINKLQKKAEVLQTKRRKPVIASIITSMREYDITPEEIAAAFGAGKSVRTASSGGRRKTGAAARPANAAKRAVAPKYRHCAGSAAGRHGR